VFGQSFGDSNLCTGLERALFDLRKILSLSAVLNPEDSGGYVALCPELDIASQGESIDDAVQNFREAVEGLFEVASRVEIESRLKGTALFTHFEVVRA
jgi:predicted RNase H-like HicB family nuclease